MRFVKCFHNDFIIDKTDSERQSYKVFLYFAIHTLQIYKKVLYLRTMNRFIAFNPEHDMALANGDRNFIAPKNIREMARDLAPLMDVMVGHDIMVWGWDHAIKSYLLRMGVAEKQLPTDAALTALRKCSERQAAHHLLRAFHIAHPDGPYTGESILARNIDDIENYAIKHEHVILKDPLSSSGKGLRHVNMNEDDNDYFQQNALPSSAIKKVNNWANALVKRHSYLTAEPYYDKVQDFAMEFCIREGQCHFIGYSLFNTNHHGRYESNILMADEKIESLLTKYIHHSALHEVRDWIIAHSSLIIPAEWDTTLHPLYFGIDMMIVDKKLQASTANYPFKLHPCVEINLRLNMGIIAHEVRRKLLAPNAEGTFHVISFPTEEAAYQFHKGHTEQHPAIYKDGHVVSGYHPLTPILSHTRHHAYIMCQ